MFDGHVICCNINLTIFDGCVIFDNTHLIVFKYVSFCTTRKTKVHTYEAPVFAPDYSATGLAAKM